ncbi:hypothetical protein [Butyrivibrio sp. AE3004]|uniref:hypothetical protein n=1 Tax=Butyrivibrio sp. AE3004 TaxID=1506994 RepID=UPI000493BE4C|nr:hypothetical protein [Butyrivibrio sp. AE3004]
MTIDMILQSEIDKIYGIGAGRKTRNVLIPAFLGDFRSVLEKSETAQTVTEEYMTEDKLMHLIFKGQRRIGRAGYELVVTSVICNDRELLSKECMLIPGISAMSLPH